MSGWDILNELIKGFPPISILLLFLAAGVIFVIGFSRHGVNFIKYGFRQTILGETLEKRFDTFEKRLDAIEDRFEKRFDKMEARIESIETNHFGHLKNYLGILNGVFLDKKIIDNETKARLDNELRGL
jgi:phage regulator Rha-like protein